MTTFAAPPGPTTAPLKSYNPATGDLVGEVPLTAVSAIPHIVARARAAADSWRERGPEGRMAAILPAAQKLLDRADSLGRLLTDEMGKPLAEAVGEVKSCGSSLEKTLREIADALQPDVLQDEHTRSIVYHDPLGVCAAISPWNFPLAMPHWLVVPALMAGNTVVLKPSEETPLIAQAYADVLNESLPEGVLQIVHGAEEQGKALVDAVVDLIAFTGSREAGKHILAAASKRLKRVILELGGKDPMIVLDDADIDKAADFAVRNSFRNAGQVCVSTERIFVDERIADRFEHAVAKRTMELKIGPGTQEGVNVGPMISERQSQSVLRKIEDAVKRGARIVARAGAETSGGGNFVTPTVLTNLTPDMAIMREETFGPVACIVRVKDEQEAVSLANDSPYGLGASVFGGDVERAARIARRLHSAMIGINKSCGGATGAPWVGAKESGYGFHGGTEGHRQFTQPRVVSVAREK